MANFKKTVGLPKGLKFIPQNSRKIFRYYIGIDTGVNTGLAIWDRSEKKFTQIECVQIHKALQIVRDNVEDYPDEVMVRVEDARLRKWLPQSKGTAQLQGAGSIKRDATIWEHFLVSLNADFELVAPKNNKTKLAADYFKKLTGWEKATNEHSRDAAMLVFGQ